MMSPGPFAMISMMMFGSLDEIVTLSFRTRVPVSAFAFEGVG